MIYNENKEYRLKFYKNSKTNKSLVSEYIDKLKNKDKSKILKYIEFLRENKGYLDEPYSKHIKGKIRELRIDFSPNRYRFLYFIFIKKTIVILSVFSKKTKKTPMSEIKKAENNYIDVLNNPQIYE